MTRTKSDFSFGGLVGWIIFALIVYVILPASWTDPILYSTVYQINSDQVHRSDRPTDCDFMHAPLGNKDCHYKKLVTAYNSVGNVVGGDNAPKYATNAENNTIVTYDDGKTWQLLGASRPDSRVAKVEVYWVRVTE
jgi:hypothetical protein